MMLRRHLELTSTETTLRKCLTIMLLKDWLEGSRTLATPDQSAHQGPLESPVTAEEIADVKLYFKENPKAHLREAERELENMGRNKICKILTPHTAQVLAEAHKAR